MDHIEHGIANDNRRDRHPGLFVASRANDNTFYSLGLIVFVIAMDFIFFSIRRGFDEAGAPAWSGRYGGP